MKNKLTPPASVDRNIYAMDKEERVAEGINDLPATLAQAIGHLKANEVIISALGDHILNTSLKQKKLNGICLDKFILGNANNI